MIQNMGNKVKLEPEDLPYDLEYRSNDDDAWYNVSVALHEHAQSLVVKHLCSPAECEVVLSAGDFRTEAQIQELIGRFRPVSLQVQDHECAKLEIGAIVCAALCTGDGDLRFYDAVIEAVDRKAHSFVGEEELCLCTFVLCWLHGRPLGTLTNANIADICTIQNVTQIHPTISAFFTLSMDKVTSLKSISLASEGPSSCKKRLLAMKTGKMMLKSPTWKSEEYNEWSRQDEDLGPQCCNVDDLAVAEGKYFILINNLEKNLTPSTIKKFIYKHTTILPQVFGFPRTMTDPFARAAILLDSWKKVQIVYEFLDNRNHLIVSSRGRPWVVTEKPSKGTFATSVSTLIPMGLDKMQYKRSDGELEIVHSGSESYERAKQLRDLLAEYIHHEVQVSKRLVFEEKRIWRSFQSD